MGRDMLEWLKRPHGSLVGRKAVRHNPGHLGVEKGEQLKPGDARLHKLPLSGHDELTKHRSPPLNPLRGGLPHQTRIPRKGGRRPW
eukprot:5669062-Alexandrium_andersonii.AAC.1